MKRWAALAVVAALVVAASAVLVGAMHGSRHDPAHELAASLSCPSCAGQSVAESDSPVAAGMRHTIADQLAAGRSTDQVRDWFVARYGQDVLRGGAGGHDPLLWTLPCLFFGGLAVATVISVRRRGKPGVEHSSPIATGPSGRTVLMGVGGLVVLVVVGVAGGSWWVNRSASPPLTATGTPVPTPAAPKDTNSGDQLRQAFALLRAGNAGEAVSIASQVQSASPDDPNALLILGLAQRAASRPEGTATLTRFLTVAPDHPAAAEVRRLLGSGD